MTTSEPTPSAQDPDEPSPAQLLEISKTLIATPTHQDRLASQMQLIDGLMADAGTLPAEPVLLWRELDHSVKWVAIGTGLTVGRKAPDSRLSFSADDLLSRKHFEIRPEGDNCLIKDLESRNGIFINRPENRVKAKILRDGDIILAGNHIFAFLDQRKTT
jgi:pSer/pThr/pTyr-binding forkhead associated (FHA) protein